MIRGDHGAKLLANLHPSPNIGHVDTTLGCDNLAPVLRREHGSLSIGHVIHLVPRCSRSTWLSELGYVEHSEKRPQLIDQVVLEAVAGRLFTNVKSWLEARGEELSSKDEQGLFDVLVELLHQESEAWDGYALARSLENQGWSPDANLVVVLHEARDFVHDCLRDEVARWVEKNQLKIQYSEGDWIKFKMFPGDPSLQGQIVGVDPETLELSVVIAGRAEVVVAQEAVEGRVSHAHS